MDVSAAALKASLVLNVIVVSASAREFGVSLGCKSGAMSG
jgi:hypothetical protein